MKKKKISKKWYFLLFVIAIYSFLLFFELESFVSASLFFLNILKKVLPIFFLVFILMSFTNYFFTPKIVSKYFKRRGIKKWIFVIIGGILSTGAIYIWYPLLANLRSKGLDPGFIACFLYNRAIKLALLPLMILYFSLKYAIILSLTMVFVSVLQGIIINKIIEK